MTRSVDDKSAVNLITGVNSASAYGGYSGGNINLNFNTPDLTNVKANLSEGAARLSGKVSLPLFFTD